MGAATPSSQEMIFMTTATTTIDLVQLASDLDTLRKHPELGQNGDPYWQNLAGDVEAVRQVDQTRSDYRWDDAYWRTIVENV
jgi:hypothetical protein